jgi:superfamily II DNA or RNA helicase
MLVQKTPVYTKIDVSEDLLKEIKKALSYEDLTAKQTYNRFKKNRWFAYKYGDEAFNQELERLKGTINKNLLLQTKDGFYTYSGVNNLLTKITGTSVVNKVEYPEAELLPWINEPNHQLRYYQKESIEKLLAAKHAGIEIATGLGKTQVVLHIVKNLGLQTLVVAPSTSIAEQIYNLLSYHLGSKKVGRFFDGKKEYKKLITVALPQSLIRIDKNTDVYKKISESKVFLADESHILPCETFKKVCVGIAKNAPYRFSFSATQMRNDGKDLLLEGITGPIVYRMGSRPGVDEGYLAKPCFKIIKTTSDLQNNEQDPNALTRQHLYYNPNVIKKAAQVANSSVKHLNHKVLILIEEVEQFTKLLPYLEYEVGFAHGPLSDNKSKVPQKYWESNPNELVTSFNNGELPILVGTSCIATGTDILPVKTLIFLMGGKSEIAVKQAIGRGTRKTADKTWFNVVDFDVTNVPLLHKHTLERIEIYNDIYPNVEYIK